MTDRLTAFDGALTVVPDPPAGQYPPAASENGLGRAVRAFIDALDDADVAGPIVRAVGDVAAGLSIDHRSTITVLLYELAEAVSPIPGAIAAGGHLLAEY